MLALGNILKILMVIVYVKFTIAIPSSISANQEGGFVQKLSKSIEKQSLKINPHLTWLKDDLKDFYENNSYETVWFDEDGDIKKDLDDFVKIIISSEREGLEPERYQIKQILEASVNIQDEDNIIANELRFTNLIMNFIKDLKVGRVHPSDNFRGLDLPIRARKISEDFKKVIEDDITNSEEFFKVFAPKHLQYLLLRYHLAKFLEKAKNDNFEKIPHGRFIRRNYRDKRMPLIRARLREQGWLEDKVKKLPHGFAGPEVPKSLKNKKPEILRSKKVKKAELKHDDENIAAVKRFQAHNGTKTDGVIGTETINALNTPAASRVKQIKYSMERWRWLPEDLGKKYVFVNIPGFYAHGIENDEIIVTTPVIAGETAHQTPALRSHMKDVKFYPDWGVPYSIAERYLIKKIQDNPDIVYTLGYEAYKNGEKLNWPEVDVTELNPIDYKFRQKPGRMNALGLVRFTIENSNSIYLHDTSDASLFNEEQRTFSSGCVRVGKPIDLAKFVLVGNSKMTTEEVEEKFNYAKSGGKVKTQIIPFEKRIPVYLAYMTAWVDSLGEIHFEDDMYKKDKKLEKLLNQSK